MAQDAYSLLVQAHPLHDLDSHSLGDARLAKRHRSILENMTLAPSASMPETFSKDADLQAYYRFTDNPRFGHHDLLQPHFQATAKRAEQLGHVHVIHDTTRLRFDVHDDFERKHLSRFSKNSQGFQWHYALVCANDTTRAPLGIIASLPFVHLSDVRDHEDTLEFWKARSGIFENEMDRWIEGIERAEQRLAACERVTHVMDREADSFELMYALQVSGYDSIIRACHDRRISTGPRRQDFEKLSTSLEEASWLGARTIGLSARPASRATKQHPARKKRRARVQVRAVAIELQRPQNVSSVGGRMGHVSCWAVEMLELDPPKGEPAAHWILLTSHAIETQEDAWYVVDGYQGRWLIEEANKALKTGCSVRNLSNAVRARC